MKKLLLVVLLAVSNVAIAECKLQDFAPHIVKSAYEVDTIYTALKLGNINMTMQEFVDQQHEQLAIINKDLRFLKCGK